MTNYVNLDLDGVVANYNDTFRRYAVEILGVPEGEEMKRFPDPIFYSFVKSGWFPNVEIYKRVHEAAVRMGMFRDMDVFDGAVIGINRIQQSGIKIRVCTSRFVTPKQNLLVIKDTCEFLDRHAIPVDDYIFTDNKNAIHSAISIDDSPSNIEAYHEKGLPVIVFAQKYNTEYEDLINGSVKLRSGDWSEIADYVIENYAE